MSTPYLKNPLDFTDLTIPLNFIKTRYPPISAKDLKYLPTSVKNLKYPLNPKN